MISLGYVNDIKLIKRYTEETAEYIFPIACEVDKSMLTELQSLVDSRRKYMALLEGHAQP
jgi:hypothetical protein